MRGLNVLSPEKVLTDFIDLGIAQRTYINMR